MTDETKTKKQLIDELKKMRRRIAQLEASEAALRKAAQELHESGYRFRIMARVIPAIFWMASSDGRYVLYVSPAFEEIYGRPCESLYNRADSWLDYVHPEDLERVISTAKKHRGEEYEMEYRILRPNGEIRWIRDRIIPVKDKEGKIKHIVGFGEDITKRKEAEEALRESENKYRTLVEHSLQGIVIALGPRFRLVFANPTMVNIFGYSIEELRSFSHKEVLRLVHPEDREVMLKRFQDRFEGKRVPDRYEVRGVKKDGKVIWVEVSATLIEYENQRAVLATFVDITERKRAEEALRKEKEYFQSFVESLTDWVWEMDVDGIYTYSNAAVRDILGYEVEEVVGYPITKLWVDSAKTPKTIKWLKETLAAGNGWKNFQGRFKHKNGSTVLTESSAIPIYDSENRLIGYRGIDSDITLRKRLEVQMRQEERLRAVGQLATGIAYDFTRLLKTIERHAELAITAIDETEPIHENLKQIHLSSLQATGLTRQLLLFSGKQPMKFAPHNINKIIVNLLKMLIPLIGEDVSIHMDLDPNIWIIRGDEGSLEQVLVNLALNAREAMPEGGMLVIKTQNVILDEKRKEALPGSQARKFVCLTIQDTGIGMEKETLERIFEPFFSTKRTGKAAGFGLCVVRDTVKKHGGWVDVVSEPQKGSSFKVYLPAFSLEENR